MMGKTPAAWLFIALLAAVAATGSTTAYGGDRAPFFGMGVHGNWYNTKDADDGSIRGGLQIRLRITQTISAELGADYREEKFEEGRVTVEGYPFQLSGIWYLFGRGGVNPHLILGGSWYSSTVRVTLAEEGGLSQDFSSNDFGYHGGFGLELHMTERSFLHLDVRYQYLDVNVNVSEIGSGDYGDGAFKHDGYVIQAGITFYF
jgi:outer membrane protein W